MGVQQLGVGQVHPKKFAEDFGTLYIEDVAACLVQKAEFPGYKLPGRYLESFELGMTIINHFYGIEQCQTHEWSFDFVVGFIEGAKEVWKEVKGCQSALNFDPLSASNIDPSFGTVEVVPVVHRGDPRGFV